MSLPAIRTLERKELALQGALEKLAPGPWVERADTPDGVVTAVRRFRRWRRDSRRFPTSIDPRLRAALERRGIAAALQPPGRSLRPRRRRPQHRRHHAHSIRQDALLQPAGARCASCGIRRRARCISFRPRRWRRIRWRSCTSWSASSATPVRMPIGVHTYDGDTPADARRTIRTRAHVVLSNPDMLHSGILPHHPRWAKLFENLRFIVIDELHAYRGVFGSHLVQRAAAAAPHRAALRLRSAVHLLVGDDRQSARARRAAGRAAVRARRTRAARRAARSFSSSSIRRSSTASFGIRRSYLTETRRVAGEFLRRNLQVIVFAQSRLSTEILTTYLKEDFEDVPGMPELIRGYRGGYLPLRRREIERGLRDGLVRGVVSTNALELGIDIGALDVAVLAGYPGTIAATWQRAGRAGRRTLAFGGGAGRLERPARPVRRPASVILLRCLARARADQSRQPAHPRRSREMRGVRAAVFNRGCFRSR